MPDQLSSRQSDPGVGLFDRVIRVIAATQRIPVESIRPKATFEELKFDSLDGINILFALENEFDINIPDEDARQIKSIPEMVAGIEKLVSAKG